MISGWRNEMSYWSIYCHCCLLSIVIRVIAAFASAPAAPGRQAKCIYIIWLFELLGCTTHTTGNWIVWILNSEWVSLFLFLLIPFIFFWKRKWVKAQVKAPVFMCVPTFSFSMVIHATATIYHTTFAFLMTQWSNSTSVAFCPQYFFSFFSFLPFHHFPCGILQKKIGMTILITIATKILLYTTIAFIFASISQSLGKNIIFVLFFQVSSFIE